MKALFVTLVLCSVASAKVKPATNYQDAVFPGDARGVGPHELL